MNENQQSIRFLQLLKDFWASRPGFTQMKIPQIGGQQLDLYKLYTNVCARGGGQNVSNKKLWKQIVDEFGLPSSCTSASFTLKNHYQRYLLAYELKHFFGKEEIDEIPSLMPGRFRRVKGGSGENPVANMGVSLSPSGYGVSDFSKVISTDSVATLPLHKQPSKQRERPSARDGGELDSHMRQLEQELRKHYDKVDHNSPVYYIKRSKMYPFLSDVKRVIMGLDSRIPSQVTFALNMLTLYSVNTHITFKFEQYPNVVESLSSFTTSIYPPKTVTALEQLRHITMIMRNFSLNEGNLLPLSKCGPMMQTLTQMYVDNSDKECSRNIQDIFSNLLSVGWDCKHVLNRLAEGLHSQKLEEIESCLDMMRSLADERYQGIQQLVLSNLDTLTCLLLHSTQEIRELALQVLANVSDMSAKAKQSLAEQPRLLSRVIGILAPGTKVNKGAQLSALILNNMLSCEPAKKQLSRHEKDLAIIASTYQSISNIAAGLLYELAN